MGRSSFTSAEIDELRRLVREKQTTDRSRQKALRARMRRIGFYVSDYEGFVSSDLDDLVSRGVVVVEGAEAASETRVGDRAGGRARQARRQAPLHARLPESATPPRTRSAASSASSCWRRASSSSQRATS